MMIQRTLYCSAAITIAGLLLISLYLQFYQAVQPCPLCILQRICFVALGLFFIVNGLFLSRAIKKIIDVCCVVISVVGMGLAGRQVWLQYMPATNGSECGVSLQYMWQVLSLQDMVQKILLGGAECSQRNGEFFYMDMAEWAVVWFAVFFILSLYLLFFAKQR